MNKITEYRRSDGAENVKVFGSLEMQHFLYLSKLSCANSSETHL